MTENTLHLLHVWKVESTAENDKGVVSCHVVRFPSPPTPPSPDLFGLCLFSRQVHDFHSQIYCFITYSIYFDVLDPGYRGPPLIFHSLSPEKFGSQGSENNAIDLRS